MPDLVALNTMLPQIDSPVTAQAKVLQLKQLQNANDTADMQMQQTRQAMADDQATRAAYAAYPTDPGARLSALAQVSPKAYATEAQAQMNQATASSKLTTAQLDAAHKRVDLAGQAFGYVRNFPTPENAINAINWLGQNGVYTPDQVQQYTAKVQADPTNVKTMADQAFAAALDTKNQLMKIDTKDTGGALQTVGTNPLTGQSSVLNSVQKTQSPDNAANNARIASEGAANRANQIKVQQMIGDRQDTDASLDQPTLQMMAQQYLRGDKSVMQNLGRGSQGAANLVALRKAITTQANAQGLTGEDIASRMAEFDGIRAGMRASGTASARIENAAAEASQLVPLALDASQKVARSGFLPFGKAQIMFDNQTNDPDLRRFATANIGLATAYASAMARGNKPTVSDMEHARELLSTAQSQQAYEATVHQMQAEIAAAQAAPKTVRQGLSQAAAGRDGATAPPAVPAIPAGWSVQVH